MLFFQACLNWSIRARLMFRLSRTVNSFPEPHYTNTHKCTQTLILRLKRSHIGQFDGALLHPDSTAEGDQTADLLTDALAQLAATHAGDVSDLSAHTCSRCRIPASSLPSFLCQSSHRGICHKASYHVLLNFLFESRKVSQAVLGKVLKSLSNEATTAEGQPVWTQSDTTLDALRNDSEFRNLPY